MASIRKYASIILDFELEEELSLEDLRVEITDLVFRTFSLHHENTIAVHYVRCGINSTSSAKAVSTLYRLRRALVIFLADLLDANPTLKDGPCPRIWSDGRLRLREAEFELNGGTTRIVSNEKYKWNPSRLNKEKSSCFARHAAYVDPLWGRYYGAVGYCNLAKEWQRPDPGPHETLISCTKFLACFLKQRRHVEEVKSNTRKAGRGYRDSCGEANRCAPWRELRGQLRPN
ncbi:hypothetical protein CC86DRAFT_410290 [Ophiobolus disseminans]|uniref:Uncharacterized protein n=1 Tax=Ophiobolus disseminans TaxID=1469910 RepID=A0A6A6ZNQ0_9PLEO|nr:hypothetical protein CC86DRAFT_410290 [Ophiobolus disseminans]